MGKIVTAWQRISVAPLGEDFPVSVHVFVDESRRRDCYQLAAAFVDPADLHPLRRQLRGLLLPGQRELHFKLESNRRRRLLADTLARCKVRVRLVEALVVRRDEEAARQECISELFRELVAVGARRLVFDSRGTRDEFDKRTLIKLLGYRPSRTGLTYEHLDSVNEPLLWIADIVGWCHGAGGDWKARIRPVVERATGP